MRHRTSLATITKATANTYELVWMDKLRHINIIALLNASELLVELNKESLVSLHGEPQRAEDVVNRLIDAPVEWEVVIGLVERVAWKARDGCPGLGFVRLLLSNGVSLYCNPFGNTFDDWLNWAAQYSRSPEMAEHLRSLFDTERKARAERDHTLDQLT